MKCIFCERDDLMVVHTKEGDFWLCCFCNTVYSPEDYEKLEKVLITPNLSNKP